jgi:hypothetical protein
MRKILILAVLAAFTALGTVSVAGAKSRDGDRDRLPDKWEKKFKLSTKQKSARQDNDRDGLNNLGEFESGNNPRDKDSDDDGLRDGDENAGTIESFDAATGKLVITLAPNGKLEGKVDSTTEIECEGGDDRSATTSSRDGDDNSGPGSQGDDNRGDDDGENDDRDDGDRNDDANCTAADLKPGAKVEEAEIRGNGVFEKVELDS